MRLMTERHQDNPALNDPGVDSYYLNGSIALNRWPIGFVRKYDEDIPALEVQPSVGSIVALTEPPEPASEATGYIILWRDGGRLDYIGEEDIEVFETEEEAEAFAARSPLLKTVDYQISEIVI